MEVDKIPLLGWNLFMIASWFANEKLIKLLEVHKSAVKVDAKDWHRNVSYMRKIIKILSLNYNTYFKTVSIINL